MELAMDRAAYPVLGRYGWTDATTPRTTRPVRFYPLGGFDGRPRFAAVVAVAAARFAAPRFPVARGRGDA